MKITRAGVDIAKSVFHVHAVDRRDESQWLDALCERVHGELVVTATYQRK
ncbi:MAG: hypothetical protein ACI9ON_003379 [Limisphaerales bacterium]|jgi:hypothetical protein